MPYQYIYLSMSKADTLLTATSKWCMQLNEITDWSSWLIGADNSNIQTIRRALEQNKPVASSNFISRLESRSGRNLSIRQQGRPRKTNVISTS